MTVNNAPEGLELPVTVALETQDAKSIIDKLNEDGIKYTANYDDRKISLTFGVNDLDKVNETLNPVLERNKIDIIPLTFPPIKDREKAIPILNAVKNFYQNSADKATRKIQSHQEKSNNLITNISELQSNVSRLENRNTMLKSISNTVPFLRRPFDYFIKGNQRKIAKITSNDIPKLQKQIDRHSNTIDKLNNKVERLAVKADFCSHLSDVIKSFLFKSKQERNTNFITAMSGLNNDLQRINVFKLNDCIDSISAIQTAYPDMSATQQLKANEEIQKLNGQKSVIDNKITKLTASQKNFADMMNTANSDKIDKCETAINSVLASDTGNLEDKAEKMCNQSSDILSNSAENVQDKSLTEDKDKDLIPDKIDSTFDPPVNRNQGDLEDRDGDGIPDKFDSTFDPQVNKDYEEIDRNAVNAPPVEEIKPKKITASNSHLAIVTDKELEHLKDSNFSFSKCKKKNDDGTVAIRFLKDNKNTFDKLMQELNQTQTTAQKRQ